MSAVIYVCGLDDMPAAVARHRPSHLISLLAPGTPVETPAQVHPDNHLWLSVHDISDDLPDHVAPGAEHVFQLLEFGAAWERSAPLLVHCYAGVSRSTATALMLLCQANPGREREAARHLRKHAPHARPNLRLIALADEMLGCGGRLVEAVDDLGPALLVAQGPVVALPLAL